MWYRQRDGSAVPPGFTSSPDDPRAGVSAGTFSLVASVSYGNGVFGDPYLCRKDAAGSWPTRCDA